MALRPLLGPQLLPLTRPLTAPGSGGGGGPSLPERLNHVILYGQSLAVGTGGDPALTTTQKYDNQMFAGGLVAGASGGNMASFVDLVEATLERGCASMSELPIDLIASEDGRAYGTHDVRFLLTDPAVGNSSILQLSPQNTGFGYLKTEMTNAKSVADGVPTAYAVAALAWRQGERDNVLNTDPEAYKRRLRALLQMVETDAYRLNPNTAVPMVFVVYQLASHKNAAVEGSSGDPVIAWALLDLAADPDLPIFMSNPLYYLPHDDGVHLTNESYRQLGAAEGVMLKRLLVDRVDVLPLSPSAVAVDDDEILLTYPMEAGRSLVLDTTIITDPGDYGFELYDSGDSPLGLASVVLVGTNQVRITADATVPAGATLYYARSGGSNSGPVEGPRGCLRDDQGDEITVLVASVEEPIHRWAAIWRAAL